MNNPTPGFTGSIPQFYESRLVPLLFDGYAKESARRVAERSPRAVLEIAAGTGALTRRLAEILAHDVSIVASDISQEMLDQAAMAGTTRPVDFMQADALDLPLGNGQFDVVVCQFGAMIFPDKPNGFSEAHRVLRPGGLFLFVVWDSLESNELPNAVNDCLRALYPDDPPNMLADVPYGYYRQALIADDLSAGGFDKKPEFDKVEMVCRAESARAFVEAFCYGLPIRSLIEKRGTIGMSDAVDSLTKCFADRYGEGPIEGKMQALFVSVEK